LKKSTWRSFQQLAIANLWELIRDPKMIIYVFFPPLLVMLVFPLITAVKTEKTPIAVLVPPRAESAIHLLVEELKSSSSMKFDVVDSDQSDQAKTVEKYEAVIYLPTSLENGQIRIKTAEQSTVKVYAVQAVIEQATRKAGSPVVQVESPGGFYSDPVRFGILGSLVYALASLGIFGVATPIVSMRQRGILRLLYTTPVTRLTFVLAQVPARLVLGAAMSTVALGYYASKWDVSGQRILIAFFISLLGFWMLAALGYLVGGMLSSAEATFAILSPVLTFGAMLGAVFFPLEVLPLEWLRGLPLFIPFSYLADALRQTLLVGGSNLAPLWVDLWLS
jgi:ABC-2 type transport system permease protein